MTHTSTEQPYPRYADVVHHANVVPSVSYVARKTGVGYGEAARLLELALTRGDLASGDCAGRRLDRYVEERGQAQTKEIEQLRARIAELEASQAQRAPLSDEDKHRLVIEWSYSSESTGSDFLDGVNYAEKAHGITQEQKK